MLIGVKKWTVLATIIAAVMLLITNPCFAANLLANPGFEDPIELKMSTLPQYFPTWVDKGWTGSWGTSSFTIYTVKESHYIGDTACGDFHPYTGNDAISFSNEGQGESIIYQRTLVAPNTQYTASVYVKAYDYSGNSTGFGAAATDLAGMRIKEYNLMGVETGSPHAELTVTAPTDWVQLTTTFTTGSDTYYIDYILRGVINCHWSKGRVAMDDAVLDGPAGVLPKANLTGTVTLAGSPVSGATVTAAGKSCVTGANGIYTISDIEINGAATAVNVQYPGYMSEYKYPILAVGDNTVDFSLIAPPVNNRLLNGDFEQGGPYATSGNGSIGSDKGWTYQLWGSDASYLRRESNLNKDAGEPAGISGPWEPHSGTEASRHCTASHGFLLAYQDVPVVPNSPYKAYVWIKARNFNELGFGVAGSGDYAGLHIQEYNGTTPVLDHPVVSITGATDWKKLSDEFITQPTTDRVTYMLETSIGNLWTGYGHWKCGQVVYDDAVLDGETPKLQLTGTVYMEGQPLVGATVTVAGKSTTTDANGVYTIADIAAISDSYQITASHSQCWSENKFIDLVRGDNTVDFNLYALPVSQLLTNGDFETGAPYIAAGHNGLPQSSSGWTCTLTSTGAAYLRRESTVFQYNNGSEPDGVGPGPWRPYSGTQCSRHTANPGGQHTIYQIVPVKPNESYKASVMAKRVNLSEGDSVGLHIKELNSNGDVIVDHTPDVRSTGATEWTQLSDNFVTDSSTRKVEYIIETSLSVPYWTGWANYDVAVLDGPSGVLETTTVTGIVKLNGSPVSGATIETDGKSAVSGDDGSYMIVDVPVSGDLSKLTVNYTGYIPENKWQTFVTGENIVNFDLVALPVNNLLTNAGFENTQAPYIYDGVGGYVSNDQNWTFQLWADPGASYLRRESSVYRDAAEPYGVGNGPWTPHSGTEASRHCTSSVGHLQVYQDIPVIPATLYKASVWLKAVSVNGLGFGVAESDFAGLHIQELGADGSVVLDHTVVGTKVVTDWKLFAEEFTTQANTDKVRYMMETYIGGNWFGAGHWEYGWVTYDDAALDGPNPSTPVSTIAGLKEIADDTYVSISGKAVSAAFNGMFYIEESNRSSGVRVNGTATAGSLVNITGTVKTIDGERVIDGAKVTMAGTSAIPTPLGMNGRTVLGMSAVGLYATIWGTVDSISTDGLYFTMTDGSGASVKVYKPSNFTAAVTDYVTVTGALGAETNGGTVVPVVRGVLAVKYN